jgi:hypothetical protein
MALKGAVDKSYSGFRELLKLPARIGEEFLNFTV